MPKERSVNPAAAQRKADKQKEIAKSKKQKQTQQNEKLARRNPERLQRRIDELKELEQRSVLRPIDQETLRQLERDIKGIKRAREALGDAAPKFPQRSERREDGRQGGARQEQLQRRQQQHLGKRRRDEEDAQSSDTDPDVRDIPMPRDTPPPIPRTRRVKPDDDARIEPDGKRMPHALPAKPTAPAQTVYSSAPQIKNLQKEAVKFLPAAVAAQKKRVKGEGRLLEPEEADRLEQAGYRAAQKAADEAEREARLKQANVVAMRMQDRPGVDFDAEARRLEQELNETFTEEVESGPRPVQMVEVEDEGD